MVRRAGVAVRCSLLAALRRRARCLPRYSTQGRARAPTHNTTCMCIMAGRLTCEVDGSSRDAHRVAPAVAPAPRASTRSLPGWQGQTQLDRARQSTARGGRGAGRGKQAHEQTGRTRCGAWRFRRARVLAAAPRSACPARRRSAACARIWSCPGRRAFAPVSVWAGMQGRPPRGRGRGRAARPPTWRTQEQQGGRREHGRNGGARLLLHAWGAGDMLASRCRPPSSDRATSLL